MAGKNQVDAVVCPNIHQRMLEVMKEVGYVQKDRNVAGKYNAVSHDAVIAQVRPALLKHGVATSCSVISSSTEYREKFFKEKGAFRTQITLRVGFTNVDNPTDFLGVEFPGAAIDDQDKDIGKAISYALKYALLKNLMLETGDDEGSRFADDGEAQPTAPAKDKPAAKAKKEDSDAKGLTPEQLNRLIELLEDPEVGVDAIKFCTKLGIKEIDQVKPSEIDEWILRLEQRKAKAAA